MLTTAGTDLDSTDRADVHGQLKIAQPVTSGELKVAQTVTS